MDRKLLDPDTSPLLYRDLPIPGWPKVDPSTVAVEFHDAFLAHGLVPIQGIVEKALAVQTILVTPAPFDDAYVFEKVAIALAGHEPMFGYLEVPSVAEMAVACQVMKRLKPNRTFGLNVKRFIRAAMREQGVVEWAAALLPAKLTAEECVGPECDDIREEIKNGKSELAKVQQEKLQDIADYVAECLG